MTISALDAAGWQAADPRVKVAGAWEDVVNGWANVEGVWTPTYSRQAQPGDAFQGGFLIGTMMYADDNAYYLIDSGAAGDQEVEWCPFDNIVPDGDMLDGAGNCLLNNNPNFPAINQACLYQGGGFTDWYLPSFYEAELRFRAMKPLAANNSPTGRIQNPNSVPPGPIWTPAIPAQTTIPAYQGGGAQAFQGSASDATRYWTSTSISSTGEAYGIQTGTALFLPFGVVAPTGYISRPVRKVLVSSVS